MLENEPFLQPEPIRSESDGRKSDPQPPIMQAGKNPQAQPLREHVRELRLRLIYVLAALLLGSAVGFALHGPLFRLVRRPLHEQLYYTTLTGGFNAIIKISILFGLIVAVPVFIYQLGKFLSPAFKQRIRAIRIICFSIILAAAGVLFAYYISLPAALHFLANIDSQNLQSLITVNDYLNFVFGYVAGFALLFQLPLVILFINRIKPQRPAGLMRIQRWVILFSFIVAAVLTPTPDPIDQLIMALPIILLYQLSIILIWYVNRRGKPISVEATPVAETPQIYGASSYSAPTPLPAPLPPTTVATLSQEPRLILDVFWVPQKPQPK